LTSRREFLKRAGFIAAGFVAADQLALLDKLGWSRKFFPGFGVPKTYSMGFTITKELLEDDLYGALSLQKLAYAQAMFNRVDTELLDRYVISVEDYDYLHDENSGAPKRLLEAPQSSISVLSLSQPSS
jgi:hypothetical protein